MDEHQIVHHAYVTYRDLRRRIGDPDLPTWLQLSELDRQRWVRLLKDTLGHPDHVAPLVIPDDDVIVMDDDPEPEDPGRPPSPDF